MKILFIGEGRIGRVLRLSFGDIRPQVIPIRELAKNNSIRDNTIQAALQSDLVLYLAYHHRDILLNLRLLSQLLGKLAACHWDGKFIFFNTQSVYADRLLLSSRPLPLFYRWDSYTFTKRMQSQIVGRYFSRLNVSDLYLPVMLGENCKAHEHFAEMALYENVYLPDEGRNRLAYLKLDALTSWLVKHSMSFRNETSALHSRGRVMLYQGYSTFRQCINDASGKEVTIRNLHHRYRFADNALVNLKWALRLSPLWTLISYLKYVIAKKLAGDSFTLATERSAAREMKGCYIPAGSEYQYFMTSAELAEFPYTVLKVESK